MFLLNRVTTEAAKIDLESIIEKTTFCVTEET